MNNKIPYLPHIFFKWYCRPDRYEELHGDLEELFHERAEKNVPKAKLLYWWDVVRCCQPYAWKKSLTPSNPYFMMFTNYFKVSTRGLMKNPLSSFINIFGLAAAIGICVFGYSFARWTYSADQFHVNKDNVFLTTFFANRDGSLQQYGTTPRPLGDLLRSDFPQIAAVCRIEERSVVVKHKDNVFYERIRYTDPSFFDLFTFPLKWGTTSSLSDLNSIIISERISQKYFGDENPIGESLLVKFNQEEGKLFKVTGVAEQFPVARTFDFSFLVNFDNLKNLEPGYNPDDWSAFVNATFIKVNNPRDIAAIDRGMVKYSKLQNEAVKNEWAITSFAFEPLRTLNMQTEHIRDDLFRSGSGDNHKSIMFLVAVCILMLALACFNYINIAIVSASKRLKEIGVRKSIGATRVVVIAQFLTENIVITFFALILGVLFGMFVVIPWFENLWTFSMGFTLLDPNLWIYLPIILLITGLISGLYPAIYISHFQAVQILKGAARLDTRNPMTKIFLGLQLVLACVFITSAVMFTQNTTYLAHRSWGYSPRDVMYAVVPDRPAYEKLNAAMAENPNVLFMAGSQDHVGKSVEPTLLHFPDRDYESKLVAVDGNYLATLGIEVVNGRTFNSFEGSDRHALIVNETLVKSLGVGDIIGQQVEIDSARFEIIGVAKDFHHNSFFTAVEPTVFKVAEKDNYRYLSMKVNDTALIDTYASLQKTWSKLFPEIPFNGGLQEDVWGFYFNEIEIHGHVWRVFATVAVLLAALGLYGLVTLNVSGRVREFSIRKVLGAGLRNIGFNISRPYFVLFAVSILIGAPVSYVMIKMVLDMAYTYHMPITFASAGLASLLLILVLVATVSTQIWKTARSNPVEGLKVE